MMFQKHMPLLAITTTIPCTAIRARKQGNSVHRALCTLDAKYTHNHVTKLRPQASLNYMSGCEQASELRRMGDRRRLTTKYGSQAIDFMEFGDGYHDSNGVWVKAYQLTETGTAKMEETTHQASTNKDNIEKLIGDLKELHDECEEKFHEVEQNIADNNKQISTNEANIQILEEFLLDASLKGELEKNHETLSEYLLERIEEGDASLEAKIGDIPLDAKGNTQTVTKYLVGLVEANTDYIDQKVETLSSLILDNVTEAELSQTGGTLSEYLLQRIQDGDNILKETIGNLPEEYESITDYLEDLVATNKELIDSHAMSIQANADNIEALSNLILDEATKAELKDGLTLSEFLLQKIQKGDKSLEDMINLPDGETSVTDYLERLITDNKTLIDEEVGKIEDELNALELKDAVQDAKMDALKDINDAQADDLNSLFQTDLALTDDVSTLEEKATGIADDVEVINGTLVDHANAIGATEVTAASNTEGLQQLKDNTTAKFGSLETSVDAKFDEVDDKIETLEENLETDIANGDEMVLVLSDREDAHLKELMNLKFAYTDSALDSIEKDFESEVGNLTEDFESQVQELENQVSSLEADFDLEISALEAQNQKILDELAELKSGDAGAADMDMDLGMDMNQVNIDLDLGACGKEDSVFQALDILAGMEWWHFLFIGVGIILVSIGGWVCRDKTSELEDHHHIPLYM